MARGYSVNAPDVPVDLMSNFGLTKAEVQAE
jgi:hypothetical protein